MSLLVNFVVVLGKVYSLGRREYGRLGLGEDCQDTATPTLIKTLEAQKCVDIGCEGNVSYAVTEDGKFSYFVFIFLIFFY